MKILSREPLSATSNEVAQLLLAFVNQDIHSFISTTSLQDLDGLVSYPLLELSFPFCVTTATVLVIFARLDRSFERDGRISGGSDKIAANFPL